MKNTISDAIEHQIATYCQESDRKAQTASRILSNLGTYSPTKQRAMQGVANRLIRESDALLRKAERLAL